MKRINQFYPSGQFKQMWFSIKAAEKKTGIKTIRDCLQGKQKSAGGFLWEYRFGVEDNKRVPSPKKPRGVGKYDKENNLLAKYPTVSQAGRVNSISPSNITKVAQGKRASVGGFVWKYL